MAPSQFFSYLRRGGRRRGRPRHARAARGRHTLPRTVGADPGGYPRPTLAHAAFPRYDTVTRMTCGMYASGRFASGPSPSVLQLYVSTKSAPPGAVNSGCTLPA